MKITVLIDILVTWFYRYNISGNIGEYFNTKYQRVKINKKTHRNIRKNSKNDRKNNNTYINKVILTKYWYR